MVCCFLFLIAGVGKILKVLEKKGEIKGAQNAFEKKLEEFSDKTGEILIGGLGWHERREVSWSGELGIWWVTYCLPNRYENAFGVTEPRWESGYGHSVSCVIDVPFSKINRRIGGAFAQDEKNLFLMHRGHIGGGRKGVGKTLFTDNYTGKFVPVQDGNVWSEMALIAAIKSERCPIQVAYFVKELQRIKQQRKSGGGSSGAQPREPLATDTFIEEFSGTRTYFVGDVVAECDHGIVVSSLSEFLKNKGFQTAYKRPVDLYIVDGKKISALFEVKTDVTSTDCYTATGQLLFYSSGMKEKPTLLAVFPKNLCEKYKKAFETVGIKLITYDWINDKPRFTEL